MLLMSIDPRERQRILEIAREVRKHIRRKSGAHCPPFGLCGDASLAVSTRLTNANIPHKIVLGQWLGPIDQAMVPELLRRGRLLEQVPRAHTWIEFPQYEDAILDVTVDQFAVLPPIWFPADQQLYDAEERMDPEALLKDVELEAKKHDGKPFIPLSGPRFRRPFKDAKVRVRPYWRRA